MPNVVNYIASISIIAALIIAIGYGLKQCSDEAYMNYLRDNAACKNHNCNAW